MRVTLAVLLFAGLLLVPAFRAAAEEGEEAKTAEAPKEEKTEKAEGAEKTGEAPKDGEAKEEAKHPVVVFETSEGSFEVELYEDKAPITVKNFLGYVDDKFYDGTIFHRIMNGFMIQGGGMGTDGKEKKTKAPIKNESGNGVRNEIYAIAMARTNDLNSATSQFYINVRNNRSLDQMQYCAFGKVIKGTEVVDKIKAVKVEPNPMTGEPSTPVEPPVLKSVKRKE